MGCEEPAGEGQRGWEGGPARAEEEPSRLVLSTPSSILRDRETDEVRHPPAAPGPHPPAHLPRTHSRDHCPTGNGPV